LTPEEIAIIRSDWRAVEPLGDTVATLFYANLFKSDSTLRKMFRDDLSSQKTKLMMMLRYVVEKLDKPEWLAPTVRRLGVRHVYYGVEAKHYAIVAGALLDTLRTGLGKAFDAKHEAAWVKAYEQLTAWMLEG
jgi:hemoglobin-like flavoprotein